MTVKSVLSSPSTDIHALGPDAVSDLAHKSRPITVLTHDSIAARLAAQLPRFTSSESKPSSNDPDEILREMGRKTFHYKNSFTTAETIDWRKKTNHELDLFVEKASLFSIIYLMDGTIENTQALEILNETCATQKSLLSVYLEKAGHNRSFFQRVGVRLKYFFYFHCNIVPNIFNKFMQSFLSTLRSELVQKEGGKNITTLVNLALNEASSFLDFYLQATENYTKGIDLHGARDAHISAELSKKLGLSEEKICQKFALTAVREFLPQVQFFQGWRNSSWIIIRIIGLSLDNTLGWLFNRMLRKTLEIYIPSVCQAIVKTSIDATQPKNLPFVVAITQGILEQLRKFKAQLDQTNESRSEAPFAIAGTEKLPEVIKKFIEVLNKEPCQTRKELQEHLSENSSITNIFLKKIDKTIEDSCIDGARIFLSYLTKPENSEEIFYLLLNLTNAAFISKPQDLIKLQAQYDALKIEMQREAREVFQMVIRRSVNEQCQGLPETHVQQKIQDFERVQIDRSFETVHQLLAADQSIQSKLADLNQPSSRPSDQLLNITEELDSMNEAIDSYRSLAVLDDIQKFPNAYQQGIQRVQLPIFTSMNLLLDQIAYAKKLHQHYQDSLLFNRELQNLRDQLRTLKNFNISDYKKSIDQLHLLCTNKESCIPAFEGCANELEQTYQSVKKESEISQALLFLDQNKGLLPRLYHAVMGRVNGLPIAKFRWKDLQKIPEIDLLPENEREPLYACIHAFAACTEIDQVHLRWDELKTLMNQLFKNHRRQQKKLFIQNLHLIEQYLQAIALTRTTLRQNLAESIRAISQKAQTIAQQSNEIRIRKVETLSTRFINGLGGLPATIGALAGAAFSAGAVYYGKSTLSAIAGLGLAAGTMMWYGGGQGSAILAKSAGKMAFINGAVSGAMSIAASQLPVTIPLLIGGGAIGGYVQGKQLEKGIPAQLSDHSIYPQVRDVFDHLYDFIIKPHVWKWAILDTLKCVHEAYL